MFLLGLLSLIQVVLLPGFLILKIFKVRHEGFIQTFLYSFGLSLTFNYLLICTLVSLKVYNAQVIFVLFLLEIFVFVILVFTKKLKIHLNKTIKEYYLHFLNYLKNLSGIHKFLLISSALLLLFFLSTVYANINTVFYFTDGIARRSWIASWASNEFFTYGHYLQFLPINLSLIYVFVQGSAPDFFIKSIMILFYVGILLIFLDLSLKAKPKVHLTGFILYSLILLVFYGIIFISDFNYDIPVSFYGFLSFYVVLKESRYEFNIQTILLTGIFALSAANIKLAGLFAVGLSLLWIVFYLYNHKDNITKYILFKTIILIGAVYLIGLFWYLIVPANISGGVGPSKFKPYHGLLASFQYGIDILYYGFGPVFSISILTMLFFSLFTKVKYILPLVIAPLFFVWVFWYSYDFRNLSLIIPFTAYASAFGLEFIILKLRSLFKLNRINSANLKSYGNIASGNKIVRSVLVIIFFLLVFLVINSDTFFNLGINLAYFLRNHYFNYNTVIYSIELGYYKYISYFVDSLNMLTLVIFILFIIKNLNLKIYHLLIITLTGLIALNFTLMTGENMLLYQKNDEEMVKIHNLYFELHPFIIDKNATIITNSFLFNQLILPGGIKLNYDSGLNKLKIDNFIGETGNKYVLLNKNKWNKKIPIDKGLISTNYTIILNNDSFVFFGRP